MLELNLTPTGRKELSYSIKSLSNNKLTNKDNLSIYSAKVSQANNIIDIKIVSKDKEKNDILNKI